MTPAEMTEELVEKLTQYSQLQFSPVERTQGEWVIKIVELMTSDSAKCNAATIWPRVSGLLQVEVFDRGSIYRDWPECSVDELAKWVADFSERKVADRRSNMTNSRNA
jgi:hypothetical protein